jgi:hypothetical protein
MPSSLKAMRRSLAAPSSIRDTRRLSTLHASPNRVKRKINTLDQTDGFPRSPEARCAMQR